MKIALAALAAVGALACAPVAAADDSAADLRIGQAGTLVNGDVVQTWTVSGLRTSADVIPGDVMSQRDDIYPLMLRGLSVHADGPRTLLHSDVHLGNWYVTGDGRMGLCDWALVCRGHWSRDFAYALSTVLDVADRRAWERDLLRRYLDRMKEFAAVRVDFDEAWLHYRRQTFAALLMWTPTLCHPPTMPDMQPEAMSLEMIRRITAAMSDLESFDSWLG